MEEVLKVLRDLRIETSERGNYSQSYANAYTDAISDAIQAVKKMDYILCCKSDSELLKCKHTWIVNHHQDTRYCSKGCDNFKKHIF